MLFDVNTTLRFLQKHW